MPTGSWISWRRRASACGRCCRSDRTHRDGSPYHSLSLHAGNPMLISLDRLVEWGWLEPDKPDGAENAGGLSSRASRAGAQDFHAARFGFRSAGLRGLHQRGSALARGLRAVPRPAAGIFRPGLVPVAGAAARPRAGGAGRGARRASSTRLQQVCFEQFVFARQWQALRAHAQRAQRAAVRRHADFRGA